MSQGGGGGAQAILWLCIGFVRPWPPEELIQTYPDWKTEKTGLTAVIWDVLADLWLLQLQSEREGCCGRCFLIKAPDI